MEGTAASPIEILRNGACVFQPFLLALEGSGEVGCTAAFLPLHASAGNQRVCRSKTKEQLMKTPHSKTISIPSVLAALLFSGFAPMLAQATDNRAPDVSAVSTALEVPEGNKVHFHANAVGVQIYTATVSPTDATKFVWTFTGPEAVLSDNDGNVVGSHYAYAGPTRPAWESPSGSLVVGARQAGATADPTAIPWLRLGAVSTEGPGIFEGTTYIQRVNTTGGLAPATAPTQAGQEVKVPYTAEYFFYRAVKK